PYQLTSGLADIHCAAVTEGHHRVAVVGPKGLRGVHDILLNWIGMDAEVKEPTSSLLFGSEDLVQQLKGLCAEQTRIGHNQRPLDSKPVQPFGQIRKGACAEQRGGWKGKRCPAHKLPPSQLDLCTSPLCKRTAVGIVRAACKLTRQGV